MAAGERGASGPRCLNSQILPDQASAGFEGTAADIEVQAREIPRMNARLKVLLAADTGQTLRAHVARHQPRLRRRAVMSRTGRRSTERKAELLAIMQADRDRATCLSEFTRNAIAQTAGRDPAVRQHADRVRIPRRN